MAGRKGYFNLTVLSETGVIYYGQCRILFVPSERDVIAIMAEHTPMITKLAKGEIVAQDGHSKHVIAQIDKGLLYVGDGEVSVLMNL